MLGSTRTMRLGTNDDSDDDQEVLDPVHNSVIQSRPEYEMGDREIEQQLIGPFKGLAITPVGPTTFEQLIQAQQQLQEQGKDILQIALQVSLDQHKNWLRTDISLFEYWDTRQWVKKVIPNEIWMGSSAEPVIGIKPTKCHSNLHLGKDHVPDCETQWTIINPSTLQRISGRPSISDCGACMFTALGYKLEGTSSDGVRTNWDALIQAPITGIEYRFIDDALGESTYTARALMHHKLSHVFLGKKIKERLFVFPRMFPAKWSTFENQHNLINILTLIAHAIMPKNTMMGITLHFGEHVVNGTVLDIQENTGHYTNLYHDNNGKIYIYDIQYEAYEEMGKTIHSLSEYIRMLLNKKKGINLISMGLIIAPQVANWFNNNIVQHAPPKLVRWSSLPNQSAFTGFSKGGKIIRKSKIKKSQKKYRYFKI